MSYAYVDGYDDSEGLDCPRLCVDYPPRLAWITIEGAHPGSDKVPEIEMARAEFVLFEKAARITLNHPAAITSPLRYNQRCTHIEYQRNRS